MNGRSHVKIFGVFSVQATHTSIYDALISKTTGVQGFLYLEENKIH